MTFRRKKPLHIQAIQWTGENLKEINAMTNCYGEVQEKELQAFAHGVFLRADPGEWVVRDETGKFEVFDAVKFESEFEKVS